MPLKLARTSGPDRETCSEDSGDHFLKIPWEVNGENGNYAGETVWRYQRLAWGDPEQGECQLRATSGGSKMYGIYHEMTPRDPFRGSACGLLDGTVRPA